MSDQLRSFVEAASAAIDKLFRRQGEIEPMYYCIKSDGSEFVLRPPPGDKDTSVLLARVFFEIEQVVRYVFIDEAWVVEANDSATNEKLRHHYETQDSLEQFAGRKEVVLFAGEDEFGMMLAQRAINRPPHGKPTLGPLQLISDKDGHFEGRMIGLLPRRDATVQ